MKTITSGHGNYGIVSDATKAAIDAKQFRYVIIEREGESSGRMGAPSHYTIRGTDDLNEYLTRENFKGDRIVVVDTLQGSALSKKDLALKFLASLDEKQKTYLLNEVLLKHLLS